MPRVELVARPDSLDLVPVVLTGEVMRVAEERPQDCTERARATDCARPAPPA